MIIYLLSDIIYLMSLSKYIMKIVNIDNKQEIAYKALGFSGGERHIQLQDDENEVKEVIIRAAVTDSEGLIDLLLIENALRHKYGQELEINLELPYLPYARQDRVCAPGQAFSLEVLKGLLGNLKLKKLVTWDCHSQVGVDLTDAVNIDPASIIKNDSALTKLLTNADTVLICPDKGAVRRCTHIKESLNISEMVLCEKRRDPVTGKIVKTEVLVDDLSDKVAVITDDICDGGFTFIKIAEQLQEKNVAKVILFVTHGIFSKGLTVFDGLVDELVTTNSFKHDAHSKLREINFEYDFENGVGE